MKLRILHRTEYRYALPVRNNTNELRVTPLTNLRQKLGLHLVRVLPAVRMRRYPDLYRNSVHLFEVEEPHKELVIDVSSVVETLATPVSAVPTDIPLAAATSRRVRSRSTVASGRRSPKTTPSARPASIPRWLPGRARRTRSATTGTCGKFRI